MNDRPIDLSKTVHDLCAENPEIAGILVEAGFADITKPGMLATAGRFMTIPKGARMKGIALEEIRALFARHGYRTTEGEST